MSLPEDILSGLRGFSKAMYSTWFFYRPAHLVLDAGEGIAAKLGNFVYGVERIFLSHGHYDHLGGIPGVVLARSAAMGERTKPLTIFHPAGDALIQLEREYVNLLARNLDYELHWVALKPGEEVRLTAGAERWSVRPFATRHGRGSLTLGYGLVEKRRRLKAEYESLPEKEIARIAREGGREGLTEEYDRILLAYSGDSAALDPADVRDAVVLLHESTFLDAGERRAKLHPTLDEVLDTAAEARVQALGLFHVSSRYPRAELESRISAKVAERALGIPVVLFHLHRQVRIA